MTPPYRDDLESARARLELLERAVHDHVCQECAARAIRKRRRSLPRIALATLLGLTLLAIVLGSCASIVTPHALAFGRHRVASDVRP